MKCKLSWLFPAVLVLVYPAAAQTPQPPDLSRELGSRLPAVVRLAMLHYLEHRKDAQNIPVPKEFTESRIVMDGKTLPITDVKCPVILTLRHEGKIVARCVEQTSNLVNNTVAAALQAMRSPTLPDRISREYLASLTIELQIVGRFISIEAERIDNEFRPGLDGLKLTIGVNDPRLKGPHFEGVFQEALIAPATSYLLGWNAERTRKQCLLDIRWRSENQSLPRQWSRFATLHYVTYPDSKSAPAGMPKGTWLLYRGKILLPPLPLNDTNARNDIARRVGDFLRRHQEASGLYSLPKGKCSIPEQLHAAWAMAKLGKAMGKQGGVYCDSAKAVLGAVAKQYVKLDSAKKQAYVFTVDSRQEVLATAMFALAAAEDSQTQAGKAIESDMLAYLRFRINDEGRFVDSQGKQLDDVSSAVALLAIQTLHPNPADEQWRDGVEAMLYDAGEMGAENAKKTQPLSAAGQAWLGRAILAGKCGSDVQYQKFILRFANRIFQQQRRYGAPADEVGAVTTTTGLAETLPTALSVILLHQAIRQKALGPADQVNQQACKAMEAGISFCRQMMYRVEEAYFTSGPNTWRGAVRQRADAADVSLGAAAGVIEAILLK